MKRELIKGDRVLVRKSDLNEWVHAEFEETDEIRNCFVAVKDDGHQGAYSQCRHIDDFRTGDKVQVRCNDEEEWEDAVYVGRIDADGHVWRHVVTTELYQSVQMKFVRWHPSIPWSEKEEIDEPHWVRAIFRHLDAIEAKLNEK